MYLQPLWGGLCKSALQNPENGESKIEVTRKRPKLKGGDAMQQFSSRFTLNESNED